MQSAGTAEDRYDHTTIVLHWLTAALVAVQWLGAQTIDWFPRGFLRVDARSVHILGGVVLGVVLITRLWWRYTRGRRLPHAGGGIIKVFAKLTHWALYVLLVAMVVAGVALTWARGDSIFNLFTVPALEPGNRSLADQVQDVHAFIGWTIVALAGLHASAALFHRYVFNDTVLNRMMWHNLEAPVSVRSHDHS